MKILRAYDRRLYRFHLNHTQEISHANINSKFKRLTFASAYAKDGTF